jgi:hypothetical protein
MAESIKTKQTVFLELLGQEVRGAAWELFIGVNPEREEGEPKIMVRLCQVRTDQAADLLKEARGMNAKKQDVYLRPSHTTDPTGAVHAGSCVAYPYFCMDDVKIEVAKEMAKMHRCVLVETSKEGGAQVWVICDRPIDIQTRYKIQSHFSAKGLCDKGAVSGTQYFRFPHFTNHKREGQWVNLIHTPKKSDVKFNVNAFISKINAEGPEMRPILPVTGNNLKSIFQLAAISSVVSDNPSVKDWHEVIARLRAGEDAEDIISDLQVRSMARGKHRSYARRTVEKAACWALRISV